MKPARLSEGWLRRPVATAAGCFIIGIVAHRSLPHWPGVYQVLIGAAVVAAMFLRKRAVADVLLATCLALSGATCAQLASYYYPRDSIAHFTSDSPRLARVALLIESNPRLITGVAPGGRGSAQRQVAQARVMRILTQTGWQTASGEIQLHLSEPHPRLAMGQQIEALGLLQRPVGAANPGQFDWAAYYRQQRILASLQVPHRQNIRILHPPGSDPLEYLRRKARELLALGFQRDEAIDHALLRALVLGDSDPQLRDIQDEFVRTGTSHHLAISGMHVAIVGMLIFGVCRLLLVPPRRAAWIGLACVTLYGLVVLPSPPVVRSILLCIAFGAGLLLRRNLDGVQLLSASVLAMLIYHPLDLYSAGFQLSFGTVLGLMLLTRPVLEALASFADRDVRIALMAQPPKGIRAAALKVKRSLRDMLTAGLVAWLVSAPLIAWHFDQLNPWGIPGSLLLGPVVFLALVGGLVKILLTLILPSAAPAAAHLAAFPVHLMRWGVDLLARLPGSDMRLPAPPAVFILVYYLLLCLPLLFRARGQLRPTMEKVRNFGFYPVSVVLLPLPVLALLLAPALAASRPSTRGDLQLTLLSVGAGQCAAVRVPGGGNILIDAGSASISDPARTCLIPYLKRQGIGRLDRVFVSHANHDHFNAVAETASRVGIERVHVSPLFAVHAADNPAAGTMLDALKRLGLNPEPVSAGSRIKIDASTSIEVLWPPPESDLDPNNGCLVLRLICNGRSILFCGDIQEEAQRQLLGCGIPLKSDVMVAPHHGSSERTTAALVQAVDPSIILASNAVKLSRKQVAFDEISAPRKLYRTHRSGAITLSISPRGEMTVAEFRSGK